MDGVFEAWGMGRSIILKIWRGVVVVWITGVLVILYSSSFFEFTSIYE